MADKIDTIYSDNQLRVYKSKKYLIQGYGDDKNIEAVIDSFAFKERRDDVQSYTQYTLVFYKESQETNIENIKKNSKVLDRYSQNHDMIFTYEWWGDTNLTKHKFRNGELIEPDEQGKLTIESIPDSSSNSTNHR